MTTPTQAQIEAVLRDEIRLVARPDYDETESWMVKPGCIESIAAKIAALTAAAEVGPHDDCGDPGCCPDNPAAAAAEVGDEDDRDPYARHPKAIADNIAEIKRLKQELAATIERCAQVADEYKSFGGWKIAAAIRALREEP